MKTLIICGNPCLQNLYSSKSNNESKEVLRCETFEQFLGGKGLNVSGFLSHQGVKHSVLVPLGKGMHSDFIQNELHKLSYATPILCPIQNDNRVCTTTVSQDGLQEWVSPSPVWSTSEFERFVTEVQNLSDEFERIVVAGSIPQVNQQQFVKLQTVLLEFAASGGELWLDNFQSPETWVQIIDREQIWPTVWKLNQNEWDLIDDIINEHTLVADTKFDQMISIRTAGDGNLLCVEGGAFSKPNEIKISIEKIQPVNTIGAGDIWLAALLSKLEFIPLSQVAPYMMRDSLEYANDIAAKRVSTLNLWDFESYLSH